MPSFDIVSEVDMQETKNAVDQANREIDTRFDFKGSDSRIEQNDAALVIYADDEFKAGQVRDILESKLVKRGVDIGCLEYAKAEQASGDRVRQQVTVKQGIEQDTSRRIVKLVKAAKLKVQTSIQGDKLRVTGKKRDDLQAVISMLREEQLGLPLQYINFRD